MRMQQLLLVLLLSAHCCGTNHALPEESGGTLDHGNGSPPQELQRDDRPSLLIENAPPAVAETILTQYPGAEIHEVERESWNGAPAWEVELTTVDGNDVEVLLSDSGEILDISRGLPIIGGELTLGFGAFYERSPYKGVGYETDPIPIIRYHNGPLQIVTEDGIELSYGGWNLGGLSCQPLASLIIGEGFEADDSDDLRGMDEPDMTTFHAGLSCLYTTPYVDVELKFLNEILGEHSGQQVELSIERELQFGDFEIEPSVSIQYQSSNWTDYYYGVSRSESRAGRPIYDPGSAINLSTELMGKYDLTPNIGLIGMVECTFLDSCIDDSPIIERDLIFEVFGGIMYSF